MRNIILSLLLALCATTASATLTITRTTCDMRQGLVVTDGVPRLGWQMTSDRKDDCQTAYRIVVKDMRDGRQVCDTRKVNDSRSQLIEMPMSEGEYSWQVMVWDKEGRASAWSSAGRFIVQSERTAFGKAQWVGAITKAESHLPVGRYYSGSYLKSTQHLWEKTAPLSRRSIYVGKTFRPRAEVRSAMMNVCGLGFYELTLNGEKIGDSEFAPLWSDYDRSVFYNTYDITQHLAGGREQDVRLEALLGNGFYNEQGGRYHKLRISYGPPTLRMRVVVTYTDGTQDEWLTDKTWQYSLSELTFNSIYGGEDYDARIARQWKGVVVQEGPKGIMRPQMAPPVKIMQRYEPLSCHILSDSEREAAVSTTKHELPKGTFVLDMGQNLSGIPEITVQGKPGQTVTIYVSETLSPEGACNQRQTGRHHCYNYTLKSDKPETYRPRFTYYGFKYIQVEGARLSPQLATLPDRGPDHKTATAMRQQDAAGDDSLPVLMGVTSCFVHNSAPKVSAFECSNELINKTHEIIDRATRSNMQSVFTDCPHREKLGWLEQDWLNGPGLFMNYDLTGFAQQLEQNIADAQRASGAVPTTAPEYTVFFGPGIDVFAESPEWGGALIMVPWMYWQQYGDDSLIRKFYPNMVRYVDYLASIDSCGILKQGLGDWYDYGDFKSGFARNTSVPLVSTAHHYRWTKTVSQLAQMTGHTADAERLAQRAADIRQAWQNVFGKKTNGHGEMFRSQTGMAIALNLHLIEEADRKEVLDSLIADIHRHGDRLTTGDVGNRYLYEALCDEGQHELLYKMLNHYDVPGYGYQIRQGMTTLTEQWDPKNGSSMNHFMMGQIDGFHFTALAGININGSHVDFSPKPAGDLKWVKASTETPYGRVAVSWKRNADGTITAEYDVPVGMTYTIKEQ